MNNNCSLCEEPIQVLVLVFMASRATPVRCLLKDLLFKGTELTQKSRQSNIPFLFWVSLLFWRFRLIGSSTPRIRERGTEHTPTYLDNTQGKASESIRSPPVI